jgi:hypothetical protein
MAADPPAAGPLVMLKLDDLARHGAGPQATVSPRWQRTTDFLEGEKIKASFGMFGDALEGIPQIKLVWFYGPPQGVRTTKTVVRRLMELEKPLFVPNPEAVREAFEKKGRTLPYIGLQGHPNQWDDARFEDFKKAVLYLRGQGCRFVKPTEFLASPAAGKADRPGGE